MLLYCFNVRMYFYCLNIVEHSAAWKVYLSLLLVITCASWVIAEHGIPYSAVLCCLLFPIDTRAFTNISALRGSYGYNCMCTVFGGLKMV